MSLRLDHLRLRARTEQGWFGADIEFGEGLFVLRADNSRGKSTAVKSILFALGLERMITAKPANAMTSAMRDRLIYEPRAKLETPVLASSVSLEFSNGDGEIATATRWVKHDSFEPGLVQLAHGPALSNPDQYDVEHFYVGRPGSASQERGFHTWLANFIGWGMPVFPSADGRSVPLYMEQVFPLLFVEQRRGWGGIQAQMPYFAGVTDVRRRSLEFLLDLDSGRYEAQKQRLKAQEQELQTSWGRIVEVFKGSISGEGLVVENLPTSLTVAWPPEPPPRLVVAGDEAVWHEVSEVLSSLRGELVSLQQTEIPATDAAADSAEARLGEAAAEADDLRRRSAAMREDLMRHRAELDAVEARLVALRDDLRKHQDVLALTRLGVTGLSALHEDCPVCHQALPESLLGGAVARTQSPTESVSYIQQQIELFDVMRTDAERALGEKTERLAAHSRLESEVRSQIRSLRTMLVSPGGAPSAEFIARLIRVGERIDRLSAVEERFFELMGQLDRLSASAVEIRAALQRLPKERLSESDARKLALLETSFISQLHEYDFGSFLDESLMISRDDYHPRRDDFDLEADISASDSIRVVWAYLLGLLEVSKVAGTNHPQFLLLDEPRQQSAKDVSFAALLRRASIDAAGSQVIFATSEDLGSLQAMLSDLDHTLVAVDGYLLTPVNVG